MKMPRLLALLLVLLMLTVSAAAEETAVRRRMTRQEYRLYSGFLSSLPVTVCRQKVIGKYIVDFLIPSAMLVIEVDGAQHYSEKGLENDRQRDAFLRSEGYSVLRYSNSDIMHNLDGVADDILNRLGML